jgi:hypothetical protein
MILIDGQRHGDAQESVELEAEVRYLAEIGRGATAASLDEIGGLPGDGHSDDELAPSEGAGSAEQPTGSVEFVFDLGAVIEARRTTQQPQEHRSTVRYGHDAVARNWGEQ